MLVVFEEHEKKDSIIGSLKMKKQTKVIIVRLISLNSF